MSDERAELFCRYDPQHYFGRTSRTLVETGTQDGDGVRAALEAGFWWVQSYEKSERVAAKVQAEFVDWDRVRIVPKSSYSIDFRDAVCSLQYAALFWLDAHRMDSHGRGWNDYPLGYEVRTIAEYARCPHVVLCDDRRLFPRYRTSETAILWHLQQRWPCRVEHGTSKRGFAGDVAAFIPEV
jgi:hypothetical protein